MISKDEQNVIVNKLRNDYAIEEQIAFSEYTIAEKLEENLVIRDEYDKLYKEAKHVYDRLQEKYDEYRGKRYDFYRFDYDRNLTPKEIEQYYLPKDKNLLKLNDVIVKQYIKVDFFKTCRKSMDDLHWRIRNWIDNQKL